MILAGPRKNFETKCKSCLHKSPTLLRIRAVWRGYHEIREAAGWVALVFAGMGLYRFCKYRVGFDRESMQRLAKLRTQLEVAADTIHPRWRQVLGPIGEPTEPLYPGHPHDWVVEENGEPTPLARTYMQWDPHFSYEHLESSVIDKEAWGLSDPRLFPIDGMRSDHTCDKCGETQSNDVTLNSCCCFPSLYGSKRGHIPVQVFRTPNGKNNGLVACCVSSPASALGRFTEAFQSQAVRKRCCDRRVCGSSDSRPSRSRRDAR